MKKIPFFRKGIALFITCVLLLNIFPLSTFAADDNDYTLLEVIVSETTIRETPSENAEILASVSSGDVLYCVDASYNQYDNLWYKVLCGEGYGYIYNGKVELHEHSMKETSLGNGIVMAYCRCGYAATYEDGVSNINELALDPRPLVDIANTLAAAKALGAAVGGALSAALPYIAVGAALGVTVYIYAVVHETSTVEIIDIRDVATTDPDFTDFEDGKYYPSFTYKQQVWFWIADCVAMDLDEAVLFLDSFASGQPLLAAAVGNSNIPAGSVYTLSMEDAEALGAAMEKTGRYDYGNDSTPNHECAWNKRHIVSGNAYFDHFHIFKSTLGSLKKVCHTHIFFGPAIIYNLNAA